MHLDAVPRRNNQVTGNIGLYYVCYELSKLGWNVLPTSRNARGVDLVIYDQTSTKKNTVQIKALSRNSPVPLGNSLDTLFADYLVIVRNVATATPEIFTGKVTVRLKAKVHMGVKDGKRSYWLQPKEYEQMSQSLKEVIGRGD